MLVATTAALLGLNAPAHADLVFSAPPRESVDKGASDYEPIAAYLTKVLGEPVTYRHAGNWLTYQSDMRKGVYDLVFDGPNFVSWRITKLAHVPLVRLPGQLSYVVIAKKDDTRTKTLTDLVGRRVCGLAPPNLATLMVQYEFTNPARQPIIVETRGFRDSYTKVVEGKCTAGVLQSKMLADFDGKANAVRSIFNTRALPNQAFTASPRVSPEMRAKIIRALTSADGRQATKALLDRFNATEWVETNAAEYDGLDALLRDIWGFGT
jgi:ABC-type phosphate/phosphonate transport system substrate-binding protein